MAIAGCGLSPAELHEQMERYRRLGAAAVASTHHELHLEISFGGTLDEGLLHETIRVEQRCCPFFVLDYDEVRRQLSIRVDDPSRSGDLAALGAAVTAGRAPTAGGSCAD